MDKQKNEMHIKAGQNNTKGDQDPNKKAHSEAQQDIEKDPDINLAPEAGDDLDEGELAKLEGDK